MTVRREWMDWSGPCLPVAARWLIEQESTTHEGRAARSHEGADNSRGPTARDDVHGTLWATIDRAPAAERTLTPERRHPSRSLEDEGEGGGICDLRDVLCVLPGRRAGRILLAQLIERCRERGLALVPPRVLTPGPMVDALLQPWMTGGLPAAAAHEAVLAWTKALQTSKPEALRPLLPRLPARDDALAWRDLATTIAALHDELAGEAKTFADVADAAGRMERLNEAERWQALVRLHGRYETTLREAGLIDAQRARGEACRRAERKAQESEFKGQRSDSKSEISDLGSENSDLKSQILDLKSDLRRIVLIGVTDLNALQRRALELALAAREREVTALIHAPQSRADCFDDLGCLIVERWRDEMIGIGADQIRIVDRPGDQARAAIEAIAAFNGRYAAEEITIGLGDPALGPSIERSAEWAGLRVRGATGRPLRHSGPALLLESIADWLEEPRFAHFATLLRHPDLERWLRRRLYAPKKVSGTFSEKVPDTFSAVGEWITLLDEYFAAHLQQRMDGAWLGDEHKQARLKRVHDEVTRLLRPLRPPPQPSPARVAGAGDLPTRRRLGNWSRSILRVLDSIYGFDPQRGDSPRARWQAHETIEACIAMRDHLAELATTPPALQPRVDAVTALRMLVADLSNEAAPAEFANDQIDMLGWLELHLDPAPALIITGFNDGGVPQSVNGDAFLPDGLRAALGLMSNERRYARDAYLIEAIRRSRETLTVIAGRRTTEGDPLTPSRLLLACDGDTLVKRIAGMTGEWTDQQAVTPPIGLAPPALVSRFTIPALPPLTPPLKMSVSEFRDYLACPYRYALKRLLRLESLDDAALELDALVFGSLAHEVLCAFGQDASINACADEGKIERFLRAALEHHVRETVGSSASPAVRVQIARLEERLRAFARFQAERCRQGWRIRYCEIAIGGKSPGSLAPVALDVPGQEPMPLSGKIDRIDQREGDDVWCIIDYKTGEAGASPHRSHHGSNEIPAAGDIEWKDLQLPLYRYIVERAGLGVSGDVALAYIVLPSRADDVELIAAEWTGAHLRDAIERARGIVREIRAGRFEINPDFPTAWSDDFARICQTAAFGRDLAESAVANGDDLEGGPT